MTTKNSPSKILNDAADLLKEEDRWTKGSYFDGVGSGCQMCAHGAIEYCGNPSVKSMIDNGDRSFKGFDIAAEHTELAAEDVVGHCAVQKAHYYAFQVGLSTDYNDGLNTTKRQVINKLRKAAKLAERATL